MRGAPAVVHVTSGFALPAKFCIARRQQLWLHLAAAEQMIFKAVGKALFETPSQLFLGNAGFMLMFFS
jgi:hypothetical protein